jgi:hypothetical protein
MEDILDCFGDIVGLKSGGTSDSGIYITDLEAISTIDGLVEADEAADVDEVLENARRIAILALNSDLTALMLRYAKPRNPFVGKVGSSRYVRRGEYTGNSGIRIVCAPIRHAQMTVTAINTLFSQTGGLKVYIANNYDNNILEYDVLTLANKVKRNVLTIAPDLPLYRPEVDYVEYYIYHANDFPFLDNRVTCSTCRKFYFNAAHPKFKNYGFESYLMVGGYNGDPTASDAASNTMKGLMPEVKINCKIDNVICDDEIDYVNNPIAHSMAKAVMYKAGSVVVWNLIRNTKLNRVLMGDIDSFRDAASYYERMYKDIVTFLSKNMPVNHDCICEHGFSAAWIGKIG